MKTTSFFLFCLLAASILHSQNTVGVDQLLSSNNKSLHYSFVMQKYVPSGFQPDFKIILPRDSIHYKHVYLANDDPAFNKRYPLWVPTVGIIVFNTGVNLFDTYALNKYYTKISLSSWGRNLKTPWPFGNNGWIWGPDKFSTNFLGHPVAGAFYFNAARSNGYNYFQSLPFAFEGAYWWKIFGENGPPEREDIINTPVSGALLGEILYRISSNILDDRTRGAERVFREIAAGLINPMRGINRLSQGKSFRHTDTEVYQKEPLNFTLYAGVHKINNEANFGTGPTSEVIDLFIDYGNPFEHKSRKPFDFFRLNMELGNGWGKKYLSNLEANGLLVGRNKKLGRMEMLYGVFQHFDYFDNYDFELSTIAFGGGLVAKVSFNPKSSVFANIYIAGVPFGANNTSFGPDTSLVADYNFIGGLQAKVELAFDYNQRLRFTLKGSYYRTYTYVGLPGLNTAGINSIILLNPKVTIRLFKEFYIGIEHVAYYSDREPDGSNAESLIRTEQKFFIQYCFGNFIHGI